MKYRNSNFLKDLYYKNEHFVKSIKLAKENKIYNIYTLRKILEFFLFFRLFFKMRFPSQN